jgi:hypothetical protein
MAFSAPTHHSAALYLRLRHNDLAGYACQSFDYHISNCDEPSVDVTNQLEKLFQQESRYLAVILQIKTLRDGHDYNNITHRFIYIDFLVTPGTIVFNTSLYNMPTVRQRWVDRTPPAYALYLAASARLTSAVLRLLEGGCHVDEEDTSGGTSLYYACLNGNLDILQFLFTKAPRSTRRVDISATHCRQLLLDATSR